MKTIILLLATLPIFAGQVTLYRPKRFGFGDRAAWSVFLDGKKLGEIRRGESVKLEVQNGKHGLRVGEKADNALVLELNGDSTIRVGFPSVEVQATDPAVVEEVKTCKAITF